MTEERRLAKETCKDTPKKKQKIYQHIYRRRNKKFIAREAMWKSRNCMQSMMHEIFYYIELNYYIIIIIYIELKEITNVFKKISILKISRNLSNKGEIYS